jgi:hypothetical protein
LLVSGYPGRAQDVVKNEKPAVPAAIDCKTILEKFVKAYSALDDKALTALADTPETVAATLKEMREFKQAGVQPVLAITPLQTRSEKELTAIDALVSVSVKDKYLYRNGPALYVFKDGKLAGIKKNFNPAFVSSFWQAVLLADKIGVIESADRVKELKLATLPPDEKFDGKMLPGLADLSGQVSRQISGSIEEKPGRVCRHGAILSYSGIRQYRPAETVRSIQALPGTQPGSRTRFPERIAGG